MVPLVPVVPVVPMASPGPLSSEDKSLPSLSLSFSVFKSSMAMLTSFFRHFGIPAHGEEQDDLSSPFQPKPFQDSSDSTRAADEGAAVALGHLVSGVLCWPSPRPTAGLWACSELQAGRSSFVGFVLALQLRPPRSEFLYWKLCPERLKLLPREQGLKKVSFFIPKQHSHF